MKDILNKKNKNKEYLCCVIERIINIHLSHEIQDNEYINI